MAHKHKYKITARHYIILIFTCACGSSIMKNKYAFYKQLKGISGYIEEPTS